jgi:hypothetical protein
LELTIPSFCLFICFLEIHHDYIDFHLNRAQGVRILTVFLYLNDVEEGTNNFEAVVCILLHTDVAYGFSRFLFIGGGTNFPLLDVVSLSFRCGLWWMFN